MSTRQDQLHSYQFAVQRVVAALVMHDTHPARSPFRRVAGATLAGLLVAAIGIGGAAVYGLLVGGGAQSWRSPNAVLVEKETGARYVYRDGRLHPVANYASALLLSGGRAPTRVGRAALTGTPRGVPVGIPDAPDALPPARSLSTPPWSVCSVDTAEPGARSILMIGSAPQGGAPLGDRAMLARAGRDNYLVWRQRRHLIRDSGAVLAALGWADRTARRVAPATLRALGAGADLGLPEIPRRGDRFGGLPRARVGQVFVIRDRVSGGGQHAVAMADGLAPITGLQARLILADPRSLQDGPTELSVADFARAPRRAPLTSGDIAPPAEPPELADPGAGAGAVCAVVRDDDGVGEVRVGAVAPDQRAAVPTVRRSAAGAELADVVLVPPGGGAVVASVARPGAPAVTCLVTDLGRRHGVADPTALRLLGYGQVTPARLPASVVALLPAGPGLDAADAARPVTG
ncbi:type VII secretion protein EccB [Pilimelia columellifera]|uniref:Type VII secretion protein EccB n=1 Tax=Pilimelia columellifera subsp. columellifera TaxID=706583 RepID=A0ABN3MXR7_9ACTN